MNIEPTALEKLFMPDDAIEAGWVELLKRKGIAAFMQREFENLPNLRVDVQCALGAAGSHRKIQGASAWLDSWSFRLTLGVCTPRSDDQGEAIDPAFHSLMRARIRIIAQYASAELDDRTLFPHHVLSMIQEDGTAPSVVSGDNCDVSEIAFRGVVSIHKDAWPSAD